MFIPTVIYLIFKDIYETICKRIYDRRLWKNTRYNGMKFTMESGWDDFDKKYASPVFRFDNGERVVIDRTGNIVVL